MNNTVTPLTVIEHFYSTMSTNELRGRLERPSKYDVPSMLERELMKRNAL